MKFAPRAIIDDAFISVMLKVYKSILRKKTNELETASRYRRGEENIRPVIARLDPIIKNINDGRTGMDYEKTRLRILPFAHYSALNYDGSLWLTGKTRPIIIESFGTTYHMGPYKVCIPVSAFADNSLDYIHFIPLKNVKSYNRHPHHHANFPGDNHFVYYFKEGEDEGKIVYPLADKPSTCWGNYGAILLACMADGDIPELFRNFYIYLTRYDSGSPLIHLANSSAHGIECVDFDTTTPWEEA